MNNIDIKQPILSYNIDKIIDIIKKIIMIDNYKIDIFLFYPEKKEWFDKNILFISKILKNNPDITKSIMYYKNIGYILINTILINEKLPFILQSSKLLKNFRENKTKINTKSLYIFPDDIEKIKLYEKNKINSHINNIDMIFQKKNYLDDCVLFRGINENNYVKKDINQLTDIQMFFTLSSNKIKNKVFKNNENEILFKNYSSFSLNPYIPLNFINKNIDNSISYYLILRIKKEHNIPGFFLSNIFNNNLNNLNNFSSYNSIDYDEFEILISRDLKIKILKVKNIKKNNIVQKNLSIKKTYELKNLKSNKINYHKIKIIYAETLPFEYPSRQYFDGYKYLCS